MAQKKLRLQWREGNQVTLLHNGEDFFPALYAAIAAAVRQIHLETYIFNLDEAGLAVLAHLQQACERGVKVRVVIDGFGSQEHAQEIVARLVAMGAQYRIYRPELAGLRNIRFNLRRLRRLHRKVGVIDEKLAFVGGINILDDYVDVPDDGQGLRPRLDFAVRLQGPIVNDIARAQHALWLRMAWRRRDDWAAFYRRLKGWIKWRRVRQPLPTPVFSPGLRAALLLRDNVLFRRGIEDVYLSGIAQAQNDVLIANAYFFPGRKLRKALKDAARRGVRVRLLLQGRPEYPMQHRASRHMYGRLLREGVEIYGYMASYLHAKVAVMDHYAMVGSANLDPFSLLLAREANVYVDNAGFAQELQTALEASIKNDAQPVTEAILQRRGLIGRSIDACAYVILRMAVVFTGNASEF